MPNYQYYICDVFTEAAFGGNQLAVLPNAEGLTTEQMQLITREFNFSESAFVFEPEHGNTKKVRIFTPSREVPFAGHPNVGTAYTLAYFGAFGDFEDKIKVVFEEKAGLVEIEITKHSSDKFYCELKAPEDFSIKELISAEEAARALNINPDEINTDNHLPQIASVGLPFIMTELKNLDVLAKARANVEVMTQMESRGIWPTMHNYVRLDDGHIQTRMFAPLAGVPEDAATGSANCALTALLHHIHPEDSLSMNFLIDQGIEMGRPSKLYSRAKKKNGQVKSVWIGGHCVMVARGIFLV